MKAILVIDLPKNCCECELSVTDSICEYCAITETLIQNTYNESANELKRNNDCPLIPMPLKRETRVYWQSVGIGGIPTHEISEYDKGWNDCVDFLENEE